ncbi:hypothetical protein PV326_002715 [Microctonus aethiopoides]|nr:hypothetical protein PV326_002715 [Microctonus aethiopoides]
MDSCRNFINIFNKCHNFVATLPTEEKTIEKIRSVPNILKRKNLNEMDTSRIIPPTFIEENIKRKKQIFDPLKSELLTWENLYISSANLVNTNNLHKNSSDELESNNSNYSPMWCPTNVENYLDGDDIQIIETIAVSTPISKITNSICEEFIAQEYHEFQREMNIPNCDTKNSDIETIIELSRFELYMNNNNKMKAFTPEDPFNEIVIKNSWKKYECLCCGKIYRSQCGLNKHLQLKHNRITKHSSIPVIALTCPRCFKIFKSCSGYDSHIIRCNNTIHYREE